MDHGSWGRGYDFARGGGRGGTRPPGRGGRWQGRFNNANGSGGPSGGSSRGAGFQGMHGRGRGRGSAHQGLEEVRIREGEVDLHILAPFDVHRAPWPDSAMRKFLDTTVRDLQAALDRGVAIKDVHDTVVSLRTKLLEVNTTLSGSSNQNEDKWYTDILLRGKLKELMSATRQLAECLVRNIPKIPTIQGHGLHE
eukprot:1161428-Pelagomonas_calceolata.AAC.1